MTTDIEIPQWVQLRQKGHVAPAHLRALISRTPYQVVDLAAITKALGIELVVDSTMSEDGRCEFRIDTQYAQVTLNDFKSVHGRFTWAHELGHIMVHADGTTYRDTTVPPLADLTEREADDYAASLLIPKDELASMIQLAVDRDTIDSLPQELTQIYHVSLGVALTRIVRVRRSLSR